MSARIENWADIRELVLMSIGTDKGAWWTNPDFGSELWLLRQTGRVDGQTVGTLQRMVCESLQWLIDDGLAKSVVCAAERSGKNKIDYTVTVTRADGDALAIKEVWSVV